jgi:hypothetical protein
MHTEFPDDDFFEGVNAMNIQKFFQTALAVSVLFMGLTQTARADLVTWTGNTSGGPTFDRPFADFSDFSPNGSQVAYRTHTFTVDMAGDYSMVATGLAFDTFLFLYQNSFDPMSPLDNGVAGNDDAVSLNTSGFESSLSVGTSYVLVMTGFSSDQAGAYSITIAGPGVITAVPEPSAWLMLALGLAAVAYTQRRKSLR